MNTLLLSSWLLSLEVSRIVKDCIESTTACLCCTFLYGTGLTMFLVSAGATTRPGVPNLWYAKVFQVVRE